MRKLPQDCVVLTADGVVARVDKLTFARGKIRLVDCNDEEHWLPSDALVSVIATADEALQQFLVAKQKEYDHRPTATYDVIMEWHGAHACRDMRAESPEAVLALFAKRYPPGRSGDLNRPRQFGWIARVLTQHQMDLSVGSWQQIVLSNGHYSLGEDEGPRTVTITNLELGG